MSKKIAILFTTLLILVINMSAVEISGSGNSIIIQCENFEQEFKDHISEETEFTQIDFPGCSYTSQPGQPMIPLFTELIILPETGNYDIDNVFFEESFSKLDSRIIPFGWEDDRLYDPEFYELFLIINRTRIILPLKIMLALFFCIKFL